MNETKITAVKSMHPASEKLTMLVNWLEENSTILRRERSNPIPESHELLLFARKLERITTREFEVFEQVIEGLTAVQIGKKLNISPRTVDVHKSRFIQKMEVGNMVVAARHFSVLETLLQLNNKNTNYKNIAAAG
ncbi:LuxR C-terminal-related transcriptional regulator [Maritalea sp.]|jgi:DNA-binding NarL/FixJ family response regulator|uniref:LuxR C-terminal-related transcriptional regulator n=1 Tax=Maritalea sp. TaxID=2003361 RepID=UPI0039E3B55C